LVTVIGQAQRKKIIALRENGSTHIGRPLTNDKQGKSILATFFGDALE